jgi:hypothetical protein
LLLPFTKFGNVRSADGGWLGISGKPDTLTERASLQQQEFRCLIDLYYQHGVDLTLPIEETVGAMAETRQTRKGKDISAYLKLLLLQFTSLMPSSKSLPCKRNIHYGYDRRYSTQPCRIGDWIRYHGSGWGFGRNRRADEHL